MLCTFYYSESARRYLLQSICLAKQLVFHTSAGACEASSVFPLYYFDDHVSVWFSIEITLLNFSFALFCSRIIIIDKN